jgi:hypothetical protein
MKQKQKEEEVSYKILVPEKINIEPLLEAEGYTPKEIKRIAAWMYYIISYIEVYQLTHFEANSYNGFSLVNFDILGKIIGQNNVSMSLRFLLNKGIIETNGTYRSLAKFGKGESKGYRITDQFISKVVPKPIFNKSIIKKLKDKKWQDSYDVRAKAGQYIFSMMRKYIRIKRKDAEAYVKAKYERSEELLKKLSKKGVLLEYADNCLDAHYYKIDRATIETSVANGTTRELYNLLTRMYNRDLNCITRIDKKDFSGTEGETGRLFTNLTSMSSGIRNFLYHKGFKDAILVNIDIKNSQPFLLCLLLAAYYKKLGKELPKDVIKYMELTSKGKLYEAIMKAMGYDYEDKALRKWFKKVFFEKVFYCKNNTTSRSAEGKTFKKIFPSVARFIRKMKAGEGKDSYKRLAHEMQQVESTIIIKIIVRQLQKERVWCSTIHDSIVVLPQDVKKVRKLILEKFAALYNLTPSLDEEPLKPVAITPDLKTEETRKNKLVMPASCANQLILYQEPITIDNVDINIIRLRKTAAGIEAGIFDMIDSEEFIINDDDLPF